jgi:hypothetical protein
VKLDTHSICPSSKAAFLLFPIQAEFNGIDNAGELNKYTVTHHLRDPAMMFGDKWHKDVAPAPPEISQRAEEAVAAYRAALTVWTRECMPLDWATSAGNQGVALLTAVMRHTLRPTPRNCQRVTAFSID